MGKIKRNEACPCGSGKKYKKCCGALIQGGITLEDIDGQLDLLQKQLISFAKRKYQKQINEKLKLYQSTYTIEDRDLSAVYEIGVMIWLILNVPFILNKTIFRIFFEENSSTFNPLAKSFFSKWSNYSPSVYEIHAMKKKRKQLTVMDVLTNQTFEVPYNEQEDFQIGGLLIGTIVPYATQHNFFYQIIKLYNYEKSEVKEVMDKYVKNNTLKESFPSFLYHLLAHEEEILQDYSPMRQKVSELFIERMNNKGANQEIIDKGLSIWNHYSKKIKPLNTKAESIAAALEYWVHKSYLQHSPVSQSQLAKEYNISASTISANYKKLINTIDESFMD